MSNTKHTPGPWSVANGLVRSATEAIAKVFGFDATEKRANAKLIAAAPELLENLTRIIDRIEENGMQTNFPSAYERAIASIKKANP